MSSYMSISFLNFLEIIFRLLFCRNVLSFSVKVLHLALRKPRSPNKLSCLFGKTVVCQTRFPKAARLAGLCASTVNSQTFMQSGAARCMGFTVKVLNLACGKRAVKMSSLAHFARPLCAKPHALAVCVHPQ